MRFKSKGVDPRAPGVQTWQAVSGFWSFVVAHDISGPDYICSYRDNRIPNLTVRVPSLGMISKDQCAAVMFNDHREIKGADAPEEFAYPSLDDAFRACERKRRELLLR